MRFRIFRLRSGGRPIPWHDVVNGPSVVGDLQTYFCTAPNGERYQAATVVAAGDLKGGAALPVLYEPVLNGIAPGAMRIRGFERIDDADGHRAVLQEWHCEAV